ncbi:MAG: DUF126 domain-containing protein [Candidatus Atabeyarchaeum deiterrae]
MVTREPISFLGGVDSKSGIIIEKGHELEGVNIAGRVLVFRHGKGSTVGSYIIYPMAKMKTAPVAIVNREAETIITVGAVIAEIPLVDRLNKDPTQAIRTGDYVEVVGDKGLVRIHRRTEQHSQQVSVKVLTISLRVLSPTLNDEDK